MFMYQLWVSALEGKLGSSNGWPDALKTFNTELKAYRDHKTQANLLKVEEALGEWLLTTRPKTESQAMVSSKNHLPQSITRQLTALDVDVIAISKSLTQTMVEDGVGRNINPWNIYYQIDPTLDYNIRVKVPIYAISGVGQQMPDTQHTGIMLTDKVRFAWSATIGKIWQGAEFVYEDGGKTIFQDKIKFEIEWISAQRAVANSVLNTNTVVCVLTNPRSRGGDKPVDGTVNTKFWGANDGKYIQGQMKCAIAHEFGHLLGNPDEYNHVYFQGKWTSNSGGIMDQHEMETPKPGHFYLIGSALAKHFGFPAHKCFIDYRTKRFQVSKFHPWG